MPHDTFAAFLEECIRQDAGLLGRLKKRGLRETDVASLRKPDCHERVHIRFVKILATENLSPTPFQFSRAKRELWGDDDRLPEVTDHARLGAIVTAAVKRTDSAAIARAAGLSGNRPLLVACLPDALPRLETEKQLLLAALRDRDGLPVPKKPAKVVAPPSAPLPSNPWAVLRNLAKRQPTTYASPLVAKRLGISENRVRHFWKGDFDPTRPLDQKLLAVFPELTPKEILSPEPKPPKAVKTQQVEPAPSASVTEPTTPTVVSSALASLRASVNMLVRLQEVDALTEGDRMNVYATAIKLLDGTGINQAFIERLGKVNPLNHGSLPSLLKGHGKGS